MNHASIWLRRDYPKYPAFSSQDLRQYDAAVVGGGLAGLSAAYGLTRLGLRPVLFERFRIAGGSTGMSGGFLTPNTTLDLRELLERYGEADGRQLYGLLSSAVDQIGAEGVDCGFQRTGAYYLCAEPSHRDKIRAEYRAHRRLDHPALLIEEAKNLPVAGTYGALRTENDCAMDPAAFAYGLAARIQERGGLILEGTGVDEIRPDRSGPVLRLGNSLHPFPKVILAINGWPGLASPHPRLRLMAVPLASHIMITKPIREADRIWRKELMWDSYEVYHYLRFLPEGRILVGGEDRWFGHPFHGPLPEKSKYNRRLMLFLESLFPGIKMEMESAWSGYLSYPIDGLPVIAEEDSVIHLVSDGLPFAWVLGQMAARRTAGKPDAEERFFRPDRKLAWWMEMFFRLPMPETFKRACIKTGLASYRIEDTMDKTIRW